MYSLSRFELTYRYPNRILVTNEVQSWLEIDSLKFYFWCYLQESFLMAVDHLHFIVMELLSLW